MTTALINGVIFTGEHWLTNHAVVIDGKRITAVCPTGELPASVSKKIDLHQQRLLPGLIDTQVNGGGGALFNDAPTVETLKIIGNAHRHYGTTGFLPTLISDDLAVVEKAIKAVAQAIQEEVPGVLGIHLEGPFLNPLRKGIHNADKFRILDKQAAELLTSLGNGKTLITLAPELTTPEMIKQLRASGAVVAGAHSAANYDETRRALDAGLSSFTHLFNAMTPLTSREPGMVGAALEDRTSWCGIIVDGYHAHPASLKVAIAAKPRGKMVLVTDAMPTVGATEKYFVLNGETIYSKDGRCASAAGTLAGSDLDMLSAVRNTTQLLDIGIGEAVRMASEYPATMMGLQHQLGAIKKDYLASMILVDEQLNLLRSWIDGEENSNRISGASLN